MPVFSISESSLIPNSKSKIIPTSLDNQTSIKICIYQGEDIDNISNNFFIHEILITDIEEAPAGEMKFEVTFEIDINSCLNVTAINLNNEKSIKANFNDVYSNKK